MSDRAPLIYIHQGNQTPAVVQGFLELRGQMSGEPLGATVFLPRYVPSTSHGVIADFAATASSVIADPESHRLELPFSERGRGRNETSYLQESDPIANRQRFVEGVLAAQIDAGATELVSPWLTHGINPATKNLRASLRFAEEAASHALSTGRPLFFGFAVTQQVLADGDLRDDFLDQLVELPEGDIYLRVRVTPPASYQQYADVAALTGLRVVVEQLAKNGRSTVLPQSGLSGWLMLPFGAAAFGTGINASLQRFAEPTDGFGQQPLDWYFLPQLLGFVLRQEAMIISKVPGYRQCECPYCERLALGGGAWNKLDAGLHYLWCAARFAAEVSKPGRSQAQALQALLATAQDFWTTVQRSSVQLDRRSEPRHLGVWSEVVA